jgi:aminoglycoside phosphotransferase (APT) family kinase protein
MERSSSRVISAICDEVARLSAANGTRDAGHLTTTIGPLLEWVLLNETGPVAPDQPISLRAAPSGEEGAPPLRPDVVTGYLRQRFDDPAAEATEIQPILGGYSKRTTFVACRVRGQHEEMVLRQILSDQPDEQLSAEYEVIRFAFSQGLLAPEPLWIEPHQNRLGGPFFVTRRRPGANLGDVFGSPTVVSRGVGEDLATFLARLHALDASTLAATPGRSMFGAGKVVEAVDACLGRLSSSCAEPGPAADTLFAWLRDNLPPEPDAAVLVHGDVGLHNVLVDGGRVSVVLDWERAHLGEPAEDLAYLRPSLKGVIDWDDFMKAYLSSGGRAPDPPAERFYRVWQDVWRYVACMQLRAEFEHSGRLSSAFAGLIFGPRFLASAAAAAFGTPEPAGSDR